jgi:hypothetical protein
MNLLPLAKATIAAWMLLTVSVCSALDGRVIDTDSAVAIADAIITVGSTVTTSDEHGNFHIDALGDRVSARAPGYLANSVGTSDFPSALNTIQLMPFRPKALYLSAYSMAYAPKRAAAMALIRSGSLNAVVVDLKNDQGLVDYPTAAPLAREVGARRITTMHNLAAAVARLRAQNLYVIARIVVFKDDLVAKAHPDWAVKLDDGSIYKDREGLAWVDPFRQEQRDYIVMLATEAAKAGFDEVQLDYIRFPDALHVQFSQPNTEAARVGAITAMLSQVHDALVPYNVFLAADAFGYVCWNSNDTRIGQHLEDMLAVVDYLSPMLYPSGFQFGIPGYTDPVAHPLETVQLTLNHAKRRAKIAGLRLRPWLQDFRDYAFDHRAFGADEVSAQIRAADEAETDGWMLWNPRNVYTPLPAPVR